MTAISSNFRIRGTTDGSPVQYRKFDVKAGSAGSIPLGSLVIQDAGNAGYVKFAPDGTNSDSIWIGIASTTSTDTASADGVVEVAYSIAGLVVEGTATTPGNLAQALELTRVTLDVTSTTQTIDENDTTKGVMQILPDLWNATTGRLQVVIPGFNAY